MHGLSFAIALGYQNISEVLLARGGKDWADWDKFMTASFNRIQNEAAYAYDLEQQFDAQRNAAVQRVERFVAQHELEASLELVHTIDQRGRC